MPPLECATGKMGSLSTAVMCKTQPRKRSVINASDEMPTNVWDTRSTDGNQHWGWGADSQTLLCAAWASFRALYLLCRIKTQIWQ